MYLHKPIHKPVNYFPELTGLSEKHYLKYYLLHHCMAYVALWKLEIVPWFNDSSHGDLIKCIRYANELLSAGYNMI